MMRHKTLSAFPASFMYAEVFGVLPCRDGHVGFSMKTEQGDTVRFVVPVASVKDIAAGLTTSDNAKEIAHRVSQIHRDPPR